jgi:hypothetical protein
MTNNLEGLDITKLLDSRDVDTLEGWADRNGVTEDTVRAWAQRGVIPTVKLGKRRMVNCVQLRNWLLEQEWTA